MADLNLGDGKLYINGEYVGDVKSFIADINEYLSDPINHFHEVTTDPWPDVVIEDVLDADLIGD